MYREESARIQHRMSSFTYISFIIFGIKGRHDQAFTYVVLPVVCGMKAPLLIVTIRRVVTIYSRLCLNPWGGQHRSTYNLCGAQPARNHISLLCIENPARND